MMNQFSPQKVSFGGFSNNSTQVFQKFDVSIVNRDQVFKNVPVSLNWTVEKLYIHLAGNFSLDKSSMRVLFGEGKTVEDQTDGSQ